MRSKKIEWLFTYISISLSNLLYYIHVMYISYCSKVKVLSLGSGWISLVANSLFGISHGPGLAPVRADVCRLGGTATRHVAVERGSRATFFWSREPLLENLLLGEEVLSVFRLDAKAERRRKVLVKDGVGLYSWQHAFVEGRLTEYAIQMAIFHDD